MQVSSWNPWHGCKKISPGCKNCYVYRQDAQYGAEQASSQFRVTANLKLPLKRSRNKSYKIPSGTLVSTCFTSDFFLDEADKSREIAWEIIRRRSDLNFLIFTKRIDRVEAVLPSDWGDGYENVIIGCTTENQDRADYRLPIFKSIPIKHRLIIVAPILEAVDLSAHLDSSIDEVSVGGESGYYARTCDYRWVLNLREQCVSAGVTFCFHQTGANFVKDGVRYHIKRALQMSQARKANIDYKFNRETYEPERD